MARNRPHPPHSMAEIRAAVVRLGGGFQRHARIVAEVEAGRARAVAGTVEFAGMTLTRDGQLTCDGVTHPTAGAQATVDAGGAVTTRGQARLSATRLIALGPFALAVPKRKTIIDDTRTLHLTVTWPTFQLVRPIPPDLETEARQFAALINTERPPA